MDANRIDPIKGVSAVNQVSSVSSVNQVNPVNSINQVHPSGLTGQAGKGFPVGQARQDVLSFTDALSKAVDQHERLKFSKHAALRVNSREVELTTEQLKRVEEGVSAAREKGVSDSLILVDGYALVVNTRSRTVITAMQNGQDKVYTNIDGAVIV